MTHYEFKKKMLELERAMESYRLIKEDEETLERIFVLASEVQGEAWSILYKERALDMLADEGQKCDNYKESENEIL